MTLRAQWCAIIAVQDKTSQHILMCPELPSGWPTKITWRGASTIFSPENDEQNCHRKCAEKGPENGKHLDEP